MRRWLMGELEEATPCAILAGFLAGAALLAWAVLWLVWGLGPNR